MHGVSLAPTFADAGATHRSASAQYFEMLGHRGIWQDGWKAVTHHAAGTPFDDDDWELYHLDEDFSEYDDLAAAEPEQLKRADRLLVGARPNATACCRSTTAGRSTLFRAAMRPGLPTSRTRFVYHPPISHIVADACPPAARGWTHDRRSRPPRAGGDGALVARGSRNSGFVLYVKDGRAVFDYNAFHVHTRLVADAPLPPGPAGSSWR